LLATSPLGRVPKAQSTFTTLAALAASDAQGQQQQQQLQGWLSSAVSHFKLPDSQAREILGTWVPAFIEAAAAEQRVAHLKQQQQQHGAQVQQALQEADRESQVISRRVKKLVRDFAEVHSRTS
jgi:hypothetical protein